MGGGDGGGVAGTEKRNNNCSYSLLVWRETCWPHAMTNAGWLAKGCVWMFRI